MFVERLKQSMQDNNITQADLVRLTGLSKSSISDYLASKALPNQRSLEKIAAALNVTAEWLTENTTKKITVLQAAKLMGVDPQFIRVGIRQGVLPFGWAVKVGKIQYSYYISPKLFQEYTGLKI